MLRTRKPAAGIPVSRPSSPKLSRRATAPGPPAVDLERAERLGFRAALPGRRPVLTTDRHRPLRRKYTFEGFDEKSEKFGDLYSALAGSSNKYLQFFNKNRYGSVTIRLDPTADENPGEAWLVYRASKGGKWQWDGIGEARKLNTLYGIGAGVNIRKWFWDKYPVGKVLSMAAHEVGVHVVPYMDELMEKLPMDAKVKADKSNIDSKKQHGPKGRLDHLRVADVKDADFGLYRGVVVDMMKTLVENNYPKKVGEQKASELADAYLMDLATFTSSGGRWPLPLNPMGIAKRYNTYRKKSKLEGAVPSKKPQSVVADYALLYKHVLPVVARHHPKKALVATLIVAFLIAWFFGVLGLFFG